MMPTLSSLEAPDVKITSPATKVTIKLASWEPPGFTVMLLSRPLNRMSHYFVCSILASSLWFFQSVKPPWNISHRVIQWDILYTMNRKGRRHAVYFYRYAGLSKEFGDLQQPLIDNAISVTTPLFHLCNIFSCPMLYVAYLEAWIRQW